MARVYAVRACSADRAARAQRRTHVATRYYVSLFVTTHATRYADMMLPPRRASFDDVFRGDYAMHVARTSGVVRRCLMPAVGFTIAICYATDALFLLRRPFFHAAMLMLFAAFSPLHYAAAMIISADAARCCRSR